MESTDVEYNDSLIKLIEPLYLDLLINRPKDINEFILKYFTSKAQLSNGLTIEEKEELNFLRKEVNRYREEEQKEKALTNEKEVFEALHDTDSENEDEDEDNDSLNADDFKKSEDEEEPKKNFARGGRQAVSAEVYGDYHKKSIFAPPTFLKTEEKKSTIRTKILQSFLFQSLDPKDVNIIIDAMEEKVYV